MGNSKPIFTGLMNEWGQNNNSEYQGPLTDWGTSQPYSGGSYGNTSRVQSYQPQGYQSQGYQPQGYPQGQPFELFGQPQGQSWGQPAPVPMQPQQQFGYGQSYADRVGQYDQNQQQFDEWQSQNDPRLNVLHSWEKASLTPEQIAQRSDLLSERQGTMNEVQLQAWMDNRQTQRDEMLDWEQRAAAGSMLEGYTGGMNQEAVQGIQAHRRQQELELTEFDRRERQQTRNQYQDFLNMSPYQRAQFNDQGLFDRYDALFGLAK